MIKTLKNVKNDHNKNHTVKKQSLFVKKSRVYWPCVVFDIDVSA